jgi:hypothetical protein
MLIVSVPNDDASMPMTTGLVESQGMYDFLLPLEISISVN